MRRSFKLKNPNTFRLEGMHIIVRMQQLTYWRAHYERPTIWQTLDNKTSQMVGDLVCRVRSH